MEENKGAGSLNPPPEIQTTGDMNVVVNNQIEAAKAADPKPAETAIVKAPEKEVVTAELVNEEEGAENQTFLMATNSMEMGKAQDRLIAWSKAKVASLKVELKDHQANLDIAVKRKIRTEAYKRYIEKTKKDIEFYDKVKQAFEAGFTIVPDMDVELFAVRTTRRNPPATRYNSTRPVGDNFHHFPNVPDIKSNNPPAGEGKYVDPRPYVQESTHNFRDSKNVDQLTKFSKASSFDTRLDFPFKLAKPAILDRVMQAGALKIFDEMGVLPATHRQPDPVVVGRIRRRVGPYSWKSMTFIIAWFIDTKDL